MNATEIKKGMTVLYDGYPHTVIEVQPPDNGNPKRGIKPACKFQFSTDLGPHSTTIQVKMAFDQEVEVVA